MNRRPPLAEDMKELRRLVRDGKLFAVQKWIADGKRTFDPDSAWSSPLEIAVDTGFHSMVELLLRQGADQEQRDYMLARAVGDANFELIKLLVEFGADPRSAHFTCVCRTGHPFIIKFFVDHGIDAETDQPFARALCYPKHRYLGVYMRYRKKFPTFKRQLNLALRHLARQGNLKWVSLLMWAGGDPHLRLPDIGERPSPRTDTSALEEAVRTDRHEVVDKIGIDPKRDNIDRMFELACLLGHAKMAEKLLAHGAKAQGKNDSGKPMEDAIFHLQWQMDEHYGIRSEIDANEALAAVTRLADLGARWQPKGSDLRRFRRYLYFFDLTFSLNLIRTLHEHKVCTAETLLKLITAPKMKTYLGYRRPELVKYLSASLKASPKP
jgi:ankyrin repeat protein